MEQRRRVLIVGGVVLLATLALGVQAVVVDRGATATTYEDGQPYPGNTLIGVHSWADDGKVVEVTPEGDVVWEYGVGQDGIESARFFGLDPLRAGESAPNVTVESDGQVVLFVFAEIIPAEDCSSEFLRHEQNPQIFDPAAQDHCVLNRVVLMDRGPDRDRHDIVWEYRWYDEMVHWHEVHDAIVTEDGQVAIIDMGNNRVFTVDEGGDITWEWHAEDNIGRGTDFFAEHVEDNPAVDDPDDYAKRGEFDDWTHWNDIDESDDGTFYLSVRNYDTLIEVDPETDAIVDVIGSPGDTDVMHNQHNPQHLDEHGTVLVADSENDRVVELDRKTEEVYWTYTGPNRDGLQWPRDADRLPNGNTLITDSRNNRVLELDGQGDVVWEYSDPGGREIPLPYTAERLPGGEDDGGPPATALDLTSDADRGPLSTVRRAVTLAHWVLPTWMQLPQQLTLLVAVLGSLWLGGEGVRYGVDRLRGRLRASERP